MPAELRTCPQCGESYAAWRESCAACGHGFTKARVETVPKPAISDDPRQLANLIDTLERGGRAPQITRALRERRQRKAGRALVLGFLAAVSAIVLILVGIAAFPLQVIAACAVAFLLFGGFYAVVIVRRWAGHTLLSAGSTPGASSLCRGHVLHGRRLVGDRRHPARACL